MQQGPRRPAGLPASIAPAAAPGETLTADAIAQAVATAKEAAARIARSSAGGAGAPAGMNAAAQPGVWGVPPDGQGVAAASIAQPAAAPHGAAGARLTAEEARRIAQQAAARVTQMARGPGNPDDWAWGKQ